MFHPTENVGDQSPRVRPARPVESDYPSYVEYVHAATHNHYQLDPKDFLYKLGFVKGADTKTIGEAVIGQYKMAKERQVINMAILHLPFIC